MSMSLWGPVALEARAGGQRCWACARCGPWSLRETRGRRRGARPGLLGPLDPRPPPTSPGLPPGYPRSPDLPGPPPAPRISLRFPDLSGSPSTPQIYPRSPDLPGPAPLSVPPPHPPGPLPLPALPAHLSPSRCESLALRVPGALARAEAAGCVRGEAEWPSLTPGELCGAWSAVGPVRRVLAGERGPEGTVLVGPTWALPPPVRPGRQEARGAPAAPPLGGGQDWGEKAGAARTPGAGGSAGEWGGLFSCRPEVGPTCGSVRPEDRRLAFRQVLVSPTLFGPPRRGRGPLHADLLVPAAVVLVCPGPELASSLGPLVSSVRCLVLALLPRIRPRLDFPRRRCWPEVSLCCSVWSLSYEGQVRGPAQHYSLPGTVTRT